MKHDVQSLYGVPPIGSASSTTGSTSQEYRPTPDPSVLAELRHRPRRALRALRRPDHPAEGDHPPRQRARYLRPGVQVVLCAGAPDTPEIAREMTEPSRGRAPRTRTRSSGSPRCCPRPTSSPCTRTRRSSSARPCTSRSASSTSRRWPARRRWSPRPSAASPRSSSTARRACSCPRGHRADGEPENPEQFARDLAAAVNALLRDPERRASMASRARARVEAQFGWTSIARQTLDFYDALIKARLR